jgi:NADPH-dependent 2,4-dienoyl-CoA reductase/sulfur reductase-like enzyme
MTTGPRFVIIGGGLAAFRAAERLCERGFGGSITIVTAERYKPYNRPPLSKQLLNGKVRPEALRLRALTELNVTWRQNARAIGLDPHRRVVLLPGGEEIPYDGLVIATGMEARHLPGAPMHCDRVWGMRTLDDVTGLQRAMVRAKRVAIVGGGFIGCEAASSIRERACGVTLIDRAPALLNRIVGTALGRALTSVHREAGVDVRLEVGVSDWHELPGRGWRLVLTDSSIVEADAVLVGVGTTPAVDWLGGLGLDLSDGILCGPSCHVVGLVDVVACGDAARWPNDRFSHTPRRVEHWINAVEMARHAVDSLLSGAAAAPPFRPIPRFWSEQHGIRIQAVGVPTLGPDVEFVDGFLERSRRALATFSDNEWLMGAIAINHPTALIDYSERLEQQAPVPRRRLAEAPRAVDRVA